MLQFLCFHIYYNIPFCPPFQIDRIGSDESESQQHKACGTVQNTDILVKEAACGKDHQQQGSEIENDRLTFDKSGSHPGDPGKPEITVENDPHDRFSGEKRNHCNPL